MIELVLALQGSAKKSCTSSKPPSTNKNEKSKNSHPGGAEPGHEAHDRRLTDKPDEFPDHKPNVYGRCGGAFAADMNLIGEYDEIEIPSVKRYVVRHRRYACHCAACAVEAKATTPARATTTMFGPRIHALTIYLKGFQVPPFERLRFVFRSAFGLTLNDGELIKKFIRSRDGFKNEADNARVILRAARVVASDETVVRIEGTNSYHLVFRCKDAEVHQPDHKRAGCVVAEAMGWHLAADYISNR